jgi:hypothetical protein
LSVRPYRETVSLRHERGAETKRGHKLTEKIREELRSTTFTGNSHNADALKS